MNSISRFAPSASRSFLGVIFLVMGLNGFLRFIPQPPPPEKAMAFMGALAATGYMFPLIMGVQAIAGALLLSNRFVPLALAILAPIVVNILMLHTFLAPAGLPVALLVLGLELFTAWSYRNAYASMLHARTTPKASGGTTATRVPAHAVS